MPFILGLEPELERLEFIRLFKLFHECRQFAHQLPAIAEELKKANELKALELRLRIQYEWQPAASAGDLDELADIMKKAE